MAAAVPNSGFLLARLVSDMGRGKHSDEFTLTPADLALIDQAMRVHALSPDGGEMYPPLETVVAGLYASAKLRLDSVPALLDAGMKAIEKMNKYEISADLLPEEMRSQRTRWQTITAERTGGIRVDYLLATNRPEDARPLIQQALAKLAGTSATPDTFFDRSQWQSRLARIDPDAAARLEQGTFPPALLSEFTKPLPEFSAADLVGRVWQLRDLHGKATFVNFWATWCGPCLGEHGGIEELYERVKSRADIQVLTFSVDDDCAAARD
jgi:thiol-disulfide isomerase/thioredoxin